MDVFIEKIVARRKTSKDYLFITGIIIAGLILIPVLPRIPILGSMWVALAAAVIYGGYYLIRTKSVEFEYAVTNGELDIDKIIAQRKRKRIFSGSSKEFNIIAKYHGDKHSVAEQSIEKRIEAVSSMDSPDVYFAITVYKGERVIVFFEPDKRMIDIFKTFIPRKVYEY